MHLDAIAYTIVYQNLATISFNDILIQLCVQKMNSNYSDYLLKPVYGLAQMGNTAIEQINGSMQDLGQFANMFRGSTGDKMASFYGIFQNLVIFSGILELFSEI